MKCEVQERRGVHVEGAGVHMEGERVKTVREKMCYCHACNFFSWGGILSFRPVFSKSPPPPPPPPTPVGVTGAWCTVVGVIRVTGACSGPAPGEVA